MLVRIYKVLILFLLSVLCWSCADEYDNTYFLKDSNYFPLVRGKYVVYKSDSIIYRGGGSVRDTVSSFLKIENIDTLINTAGERIVIRYHWYKYSESEPWQFKTLSSSFLRDQYVLTTEDNVTLVKLPLFPRKNLKFLPAVYVNPELQVDVSGELFSNFYRDWNGKILDTTTPYTLGDNQLNACYVQMVADTLLRIQKRHVTEIYGHNIGLLERNEVFLFDDQSGNTPIEDRAKKGYIHRLKIWEYN
jgi:hypothetical protein